MNEPAYRPCMKNLMPAMLVFLLLGCAGSSGGPQAVRGDDPVTQDPAFFDSGNPPRIAETRFDVAGANLNAIVYEAQGAGPHPTVLLLHGFPGNEKNLDLAQAIRRAGWNVVFFHYRGTWGSGGTFSFSHVLEDVAAVLREMSEHDFAQAHRIDAGRLVLVGHSMGGFAALISGAELGAVDCVVSLAGANLGESARALEQAPNERKRFADLLDSWAGPIRGPEGAVLVEELIENADRFDTVGAAPRLARKPVLLIAGEQDRVTPPAQNHDPLVVALEAENASLASQQIFEQADHSFSGQRIALARSLTDWLVDVCGASFSGPNRGPAR